MWRKDVMPIKITSLNHVRIGDLDLGQADLKRLPEPILIRLLNALSQIFTRYPSLLGNESFQYEAGDLTQTPDELKDILCRIYSVAQYYLGKGSLQDAPLAVTNQAYQDRQAEQAKAGSSFCRFWANKPEFVYTVPIDGNSAVRNTLNAVNEGLRGVTALSTATTLSGVIAMPAIVYAGSRLAKQGWAADQRAKEIGDLEGRVQAWTNIIGGSAYGALGVGFIPAFGPDFFSLVGASWGSSAASIIQTGGFVINGFSLAMYAAVLASSLHGIAYTSAFRNEFTEIVHQKDVAAEDKATQALRFLKQQFTLTAAEAEGLDETATTQAAQKKYERFIRRVGKECAAEVVSAIRDGLLRNVHDTLSNVKTLIDKVNYDSFREKVKHYLLLTIAIVGITATILSILAMTIGTGGIASSALTAVAAVLWLTVDSSKIHAWAAKQAAKVFLKEIDWSDSIPK